MDGWEATSYFRKVRERLMFKIEKSKYDKWETFKWIYKIREEQRFQSYHCCILPCIDNIVTKKHQNLQHFVEENKNILNSPSLRWNVYNMRFLT